MQEVKKSTHRGKETQKPVNGTRPRSSKCQTGTPGNRVVEVPRGGMTTSIKLSASALPLLMGRTLGGYAFPPFPYLFTTECGTHPGDTTTNQMSTTSGIFPLHYEGVQHVTHTYTVSLIVCCKWAKRRLTNGSRDFFHNVNIQMHP